MADMVRVRDNETGHHYSIPRSRFDRNPSAYTELRSPALHLNGAVVAPKFKSSVSSESEKKSTTNAGQSADSPKEK